MAKNVETWREGGFFDDLIRKPLSNLKGEINEYNYKKLEKKNSKKTLDNTKLYGWGKEKLTKKQVMQLVGWIPSPYGREFVKRIENGDIKWLQKFLNGIVDKLGLWRNAKFKATLKSKGMWLKDGKHILEDWKLGPQTMETLKFLAENRDFFEQLNDTYFPFFSWKSRLY